MARPKGSKNKVGAEVKAQIAACFERLGGLAAYEKWARNHESEFYKAWAQLAPKEVTADVTYRDETDLTDAELAAIATGRGEGAAETTGGEEVAPGVH
jgi:hypothetical protein